MQGLRERKKAATRQAISDVATRLFERDGFERVTVAAVAAAAGVSIKTVFNYFGSKEELFFDAEEEILASLIERVRDRPPGTSPTAALRPALLDGPFPTGACPWSRLDASRYEAVRAFIVCEAASPALSARRLVIADGWAPPLAAAAGSEAWAAMLVGILNLRHRIIATALIERRTPRTIERRIRTTVGEALDALERAFPA